MSSSVFQLAPAEPDFGIDQYLLSMNEKVYRMSEQDKESLRFAMGAESVLLIDLPPKMTKEEIATLLYRMRDPDNPLDAVMRTYSVALKTIKLEERFNTMEKCLMLDPSSNTDKFLSRQDAGEPLSETNCVFRKLENRMFLSTLMQTLTWCGALKWLNVRSDGTISLSNITSFMIYNEPASNPMYNAGIVMRFVQRIEPDGMLPPLMDSDRNGISRNYVVLIGSANKLQVIHEFNVEEYGLADNYSDFEKGKTRKFAGRTAFAESVDKWKTGTRTTPLIYYYQIRANLDAVASIALYWSDVCSFPVDYVLVLRNYAMVTTNRNHKVSVSALNMLYFSVPRLILRSVMSHPGTNPYISAAYSFVASLICQILFNSLRTINRRNQPLFNVAISLCVEDHPDSKVFLNFPELYRRYQTKSFNALMETHSGAIIGLVSDPMSPLHWLWQYMTQYRTSKSLVKYNYLVNWWPRDKDRPLSEAEITMRCGLLNTIHAPTGEMGAWATYPGCPFLTTLFGQMLDHKLTVDASGVFVQEPLRVCIKALISGLSNGHAYALDKLIEELEAIHNVVGPLESIQRTSDASSVQRKRIISSIAWYEITDTIIFVTNLLEQLSGLQFMLMSRFIANPSTFSLLCLAKAATPVPSVDRYLALDARFYECLRDYLLPENLRHRFRDYKWIWLSADARIIRAYLYSHLDTFLPLFDRLGSATNLAYLGKNVILEDCIYFQDLVNRDEERTKLQMPLDHGMMFFHVSVTLSALALVVNWSELLPYDPNFYVEFDWTTRWLQNNQAYVQPLLPLVLHPPAGTRKTIRHIRYEISQDLDERMLQLSLLQGREREVATKQLLYWVTSASRAQESYNIGNPFVPPVLELPENELLAPMNSFQLS